MNKMELLSYLDQIEQEIRNIADSSSEEEYIRKDLIELADSIMQTLDNI